jgi:hypothetical protein
MPAKKDRDPHRDIPKDAEGNPIFFILPDGIKASYERKLRSAKETWLATGDTGALRKAAYDIKHHRQTMVEADWFFDAIVTILANMRSDDDVRRARHNAVHRDRIADATAAGVKLSIDEASERAVNFLKDSAAIGTPEDMRRSYFKVKKALKQGLGGAFNTIHIPRGQSR